MHDLSDVQMFRCKDYDLIVGCTAVTAPQAGLYSLQLKTFFFFLPCQIILFQDMELFSEPILPPSSLTECRVALRYWQPPHLLHNNVPLKRRISPKSLNTLLTPACCYLYILG